MKFSPWVSFPFMSHRFSLMHLQALPTLAMNRLLGYSGSAITGLFFSIFLFEFFDLSVQMVLVWYLVAYLVRIPTHTLAAKIFSKTGLVPSMAIGTVGAIVYYLSLYALDVNVALAPNVFLGLAIFGLTILSAFYWTPFHVDFAEFSTKGRRGHQLALYYSAIRLLGVIAPILGGFLITQYGYSVIFLFAIFALLLSFIPMAHLPRTYVQYEFGFFETFKKMFSKDFRALTVSMMSHGAENIVGIIIWPIFLFSVFQGQYLDVGIFAGAVVIITLALQMFVGSQVDKRPVKRILKWGTQIYALGWFAKALVDTVFGVFAASAFHSFGSIMMRTPLDAIYYEKAADSGHYVDEFTVIKETAITFGRVLMVAILIGVTTWTSLQGSFVVAAVVSLGIAIIANAHAKKV